MPSCGKGGKKGSKKSSKDKKSKKDKKAKKESKGKGGGKDKKDKKSGKGGKGGIDIECFDEEDEETIDDMPLSNSPAVNATAPVTTQVSSFDSVGPTSGSTSISLLVVGLVAVGATVVAVFH